MRVVALDLPTSCQMVDNGDEFMTRMAESINSTLLCFTPISGSLAAKSVMRNATVCLSPVIGKD